MEHIISCSVSNCEKPAKKLGWCHAHYQRARLGQPMETPIRSWGSAGEQPCKIEACGKPAHAQDLCSAHYRRHRLGLQLDAPVRRRAPGSVCEVEGCDRPYRASGLCAMHWQRKKLTGEVGAAQSRVNPPGTGYVNPDGYKVFRIDGKNIHEHRLVMEQILGRPLEPGENVHHRNGQRADNRPENLELWYVPQPYGQRIDDLVAWMVKFHRGRVVEQLDREDSP